VIEDDGMRIVREPGLPTTINVDETIIVTTSAGHFFSI
jgi:hypothetical protein